MVHATFFIAWNRFWHNNRFWQFFFFSIFGLKQPDFREKSVFCLVFRGVYPPYPLSGPTTKKNFLLCVSSLTQPVNIFETRKVWNDFEGKILNCQKLLTMKSANGSNGVTRAARLLKPGCRPFSYILYKPVPTFGNTRMPSFELKF